MKFSDVWASYNLWIDSLRKTYLELDADLLDPKADRRVCGGRRIGRYLR